MLCTIKIIGATQMNNAFDKIYGYQKEKDELMRICDILKNRNEYEKVGIKAPHGLMIDGDPGVGKTLMAKCLIEESGCRFIEVKKDRPKKEFIERINKAFLMARQESVKDQSKTYIVLLDDLDKFAESEDEAASSPNYEEFAVVQAEIDSVKDLNIFVIATVNRVHVLPDSLRRTGRFDKTITVYQPTVKDTAKIIEHYLDNKNVDINEVNGELVAKLMERSPSSMIESVINEAGTYAVYDKRTKISLDDIVRSVIRLKNNIDARYAPPCSASELRRVAYHEAGHAVVSMLSQSREPVIVCMGEGKECIGITASHDIDCDISDWKQMVEESMYYLGGKAGEYVEYNDLALGCCYDLDHVTYQIMRNVTREASIGFDYYDTYYSETKNAPVLNDRIAVKINEKLQYYYDKTCQLLRQNKPLLDMVAEELLKKNYLSIVELNRIFDEYKKSHTPVYIEV